MRLATVRVDDRTTAARVEDDHVVELAATDLGELLAEPTWADRARASGDRHSLTDVRFAPLIPRPEKIICVGLNYRAHILERGHELPSHPTIFAKYACALIGAYDDITVPKVSDGLDWEAELAVVIGQPGRHVAAADASSVVAGFSIINDISERRFQRRTIQFLQGKTFEGSTPLGPWLVTADVDDANPGPHQRISCRVDGETKQDSTTGDLLFGVPELIAYLSQIFTLRPGDVIATGTPAGVGAASDPPEVLTAGSVVATAITGIGEMVNICVDEVVG